MFARQAFKCAQPFGQSFRRYATEAPKRRSLTPLYASIVLTGAGVGLYRYNSGTATAEAPKRESVFVGGDQGWVDLKLADIETLSHNTKRFRFALPDSEKISGVQIASILLTKFKPEGAEKPVIRPYTPVSDEEQPGYIELVVKSYPKGPMSEHLHSLKVNDSVDFKGPIPKYPWEANKHNHICLIAGGTGITPMYQLARQIFKNPDDKTKVTLVFGNITEEDILLRKEFDELENTYPQRFKAFYVLDNPPQGWTGGKGYISKDLLKTVLPEPKEENIKLFICGPPGMYKSISGPKVSPKDQGELSGILQELGYNKEQVFKF